MLNNFVTFVYSPTPKVEWRRVGAKLQEKTRIESHGKELIIPDLTLDDAGDYECFAKNSKSTRDYSFRIQLTVECKYICQMNINIFHRQL